MEVNVSATNVVRGEVPDAFKSGYGSGDGYGYGSGDGSGDGDGSGSKEYWVACVVAFSEKWTPAQRGRLDALRRAGATIAYWKSDKNGRACNGGKNDPVKPGTIETAPGPLALCARGTLHATLLPPKWSGDRWWIVALTGEVVGDREKFGALSREIIGECT